MSNKGISHMLPNGGDIYEIGNEFFGSLSGLLKRIVSKRNYHESR